jgi:tetraacyldisaccharide 4'-kinase
MASAASRVEQFWYSQSRLKWILWPLSRLMFCVTNLKHFLYKRRLLTVNSCPVPVIVVGNITVGGTGKTPFISLLAKLLKEQGYQVGIVSRGYHSQAPTYPHLVSQSDTAEIVGDEVMMLYNQLQLPMAIDANRSNAVSKLAASYPLDLIISDDGLQHYAMDRQVEIVLVDALREFGNELCLPFGPLRESISRLKELDLVIQNGGQELLSRFKSITTPAMLMTVNARALIHIKSGERVALNNLKENHVNAVCGIGNPQRFFNSLVPLCASYQPTVFSDHHRFTAEDFSSFGDDIVVMTEKDAVKCTEFAQAHWYYLEVGASINNQASAQLIQLIKKRLNEN